MASLGVSERNSAGKGKGLFADVHFDEKDVILTEEPLVSCQFSWNRTYSYRACEYCMRNLETAEESCRRLSDDDKIVLPYKECCTVDKSNHTKCESCDAEYCSSQCKMKAANQYHATICLGDANPLKQELETLEDMWKQIHYPPETSSIMLVVRMIALVKQSANKERLVKKFDAFCNKTANERQQILHKLVGEKFSNQIDNLRLQLKNTIQEDRLEEWYTHDGFRSILALLGTNQQGIGSSSLSTWVKNCYDLNLSGETFSKLDKLISDMYTKLFLHAGEFLDCDGVGLYPLQSRCNHSCRPNAEVSFEHGDNKLTLRAIRPIDKDDEICISYMCEGEVARSRHSRQKILSENYLFLCNCDRCEEQVDDPDETSSESSGYSYSDDDLSSDCESSAVAP